MQLTRFDRWLRETFVYEMHVRTLRPAPIVPPRVRAVDLPESPMQRYRHLYIARKNEDADILINALRDNGQMFASEVVERNKWYQPIIAPEHKSFTWSLISMVATISTVVSVVLFVRHLLSKPEVQQGIQHALELTR